MSNLKLMLKGSSLSGLHTLLQVAASFFLTPLIINTLGDRLYGIWLLLAAFVGYYGLLDLGISGAVMRFVSRCIGAGNPDEVKYFTSSAFCFLSLSGIVVIVASSVIAYLSHLFISNIPDLILFRILILIIGFSIGLTFPLRIFVGILNANMRFDISRYIEIGEVIFRTTVIVILLKTGYGVIGLALATSTALIFDYIVKTIVVLVLDPSVSLRLRYFDWNKAKELIEYSFFNFIQQLANILSERVDPFVIACFITVKSVSYYGVVLALVAYFSQFFYSILGVVFPYYSQKEGASDLSSLRVDFLFISKITMALSTFSTLMILFYARQFLIRWLGESFAISYQYVLILFPPLLLLFGYGSSALILNSTGKHRSMANIEILQGLLHLCLSLVMVKYLDVIGVALGAAISVGFFGGLLRPYLACRSINLNLRDFLRQTMPIALKTAIFVLPFWLCYGRFIGADYVSLLFCIVIHLVIFCCLGYFFLLPKEDLLRVSNYIYKLRGNKVVVL
ncbi:MAG: lipopolysaccharide biosynthesis protein [Smithellaceae bacterium]